MVLDCVGPFVFTQPLHPLCSCYAEYIGNVAAEKREEVIAQLNSEAARLIQVSLHCTFVRNPFAY